ncbi:MAG: methyltransferase regulatory domain-containing protein [Alphaproteobacteria bacterium]|nr:methyltransferase regulatory domain-containing protein [Alphaproteobacteria bacterium]
MKTLSTYSPISLRYIAALRGNIPSKIHQEFTYADACCRTPEALICLAASNPDGRFYGFVANDTDRRAAEDLAVQREIFNIIFLTGTPSDILERLDKGSSLPPMLDYLCCDESDESLPADARTALFELAQKRLNPGGLFVTTYHILSRRDDTLRLLAQSAAGETDPAKKSAFLSEIKTMGSPFFAENPTILDTLNKAITSGEPQPFFDAFNDTAAVSKTIETILGIGSRGFVYAGDTLLSSNFAEATLSHEAYDLIAARRKDVLYEVFKDFALNRQVRSDIWIKEPSERTDSVGVLFGGFAYGLLSKRSAVPKEHTALGGSFNLSSSLFENILDLMALMPVGVGDIMNRYPDLANEPHKIIESIQVLIACGYVAPMRGIREPLHTETIAQPRFVGSFNRFFDKVHLSDEDVVLASTVAGCGVVLSARDAFVMQAINRAGLTNSVAALLPELCRIAGTPVGQSIIRANEATAEIAHAMVLDSVEKSLPQWYAYALLEAA